MEKLINRILLICALVGVSFGAYAYIEERPTKLLDKTTEDLEAKIAGEKQSVIEYVNTKDAAKSQEIAAINTNINEKFSLLMKFMERLDDRLYNLQRNQKSADLKAAADDGT